jgi:hypothetical protein
MLYDVHTHIGLDQGFHLRRWWPYAATAQDLLQHMDANGIDRAACFPFCLSSAYDPYAFADRSDIRLQPGRWPYDRENELLVIERERLDPRGRLLPLAMFDPLRHPDLQVRSLEKLVGRMAGLKTQPTVIKAPIASLLDAGNPLMAFARQHDLPVLIHTAVHPEDPWSQVADCLRVAEAFPEVRFNLAHSLRFHAGYLKAAAELPNVWIDNSAHLVHCWGAVKNLPIVAPPGQRVDADYANPRHVIEAIYDIIGPKYMWGSDNPYMSWCDDSLAAVYTYKQEADVLHSLAPDLKQSFGSTAAEAWLGTRKEFGR